MNFKKFLNKYAIIISAIVSFGWILIFISYDGRLTFRIPVIIAWIPHLLGWDLFIILTGIMLGWVCYMICKDD